MDVDLNLISLEIYFNSTNQLAIWSKLAKEAGFDVIEIYKVDIKIESYATALQRIISILNIAGIKTINDLDIILSGEIGSARDYLKLYYDQSLYKIGNIAPPLTIIIIFLIHFFREQLTNQDLIRIGFSKSAIEIINEVWEGTT